MHPAGGVGLGSVAGKPLHKACVLAVDNLPCTMLVTHSVQLIALKCEACLGSGHSTLSRDLSVSNDVRNKTRDGAGRSLA